jgi:Trk K+ transport system NAD-binding subunit
LAAVAQNRTITGKVLDGEFENEPLIGAYVVAGSEKNTNTVITDPNGAFSITVPSETKMLTISYMGYETYLLKLKPNVLIAAITHGTSNEIPGGNSTFSEGDRVIVVTGGRGVLHNINDIFA